MRYPAKKIDRYSIAWENDHGKERIRHTLARAKIYIEDPKRKERLAAAQCIICYGESRIAGAACSERPCGLCGVQLGSGSTDVNVLCRQCALDNQLCEHCGADIDLKDRRKPRAHERR